MSDFIDLRLEPVLWLLGDWSLRWGVLIAALGVCFALCPPRQAALRLAACQLVLVAGLALPLVPHWWGSQLLPNRWVTTEEDVAPEQPVTESPDEILRPSTVEPPQALRVPSAPPVVRAEQDHSDLAAAADPLGPRRIVLLIVAALWSIGAGIQLSRLTAAAIWLSRLSRGALPPSLQSQELFNRCREKMGLRRAVRLGIHPALRAPVFVGGWHSSVLVPSDWEQLAPEAQRAVLWHELTHVARRDDWAKLAEEAIRAVFFFHPLVHWLLNRIDVYREQVCDAAAVRRGVAGRKLAQILVDFSRRKAAPGDRDPTLRPALPFFRRRTVKNRIRELLEEKTVARWSAPLVRRQFVGLAVIAVAIGMALGGFGARASESQAARIQFAALDPPPKTPPSATPATATAAEQAHAAAKGATVPTLERILANWKAREERTRSLYFAWDDRMFFGQAADNRSQGKASLNQADPRSCHVTFWAEGLDRFRRDSTPLAAPEPTATVFAVKIHSVTNGTTELRVEDPGNAAGSPVCTVSTRRGELRLSDSWPMLWTPNALAMTFRPLDAFVTGRRVLQFRIVSENAMVDGLRCVEIQKVNAGRVLERCWVDPARDDVIVAYEYQINAQFRPTNVTKISVQYQRDRVHGWVPAGWTFKRPGELSENTVTKFAINERFSEDTFALNVPPGTIVFDKRTSEEYRVANDGSKADAAKFDSAMSLAIQKVLQSKVDFSIEPQSMRDALDFIHARYQIPIILIQKDFDAAGIDATSEVKSDRVGIAVADLLKILLVQGQHPAGFRIEDEVLKISPKFVGPGPMASKPVPVPPKVESPKGPKIRESLEMPVDFTIEPQPLRDALDFVAARYQITIVIDPSVDSKVDVKGSFPGIRLKSLLSILLEQYPKPLGFKIEDDVLKIYPEVATP
jgi:beta-lactamase regulating signal transducer with metallopeptidase domain